MTKKSVAANRGSHSGTPEGWGRVGTVYEPGNHVWDQEGGTAAAEVHATGSRKLCESWLRRAGRRALLGEEIQTFRYSFPILKIPSRPNRGHLWVINLQTLAESFRSLLKTQVGIQSLIPKPLACYVKCTEVAVEGSFFLRTLRSSFLPEKLPYHLP